jgi:hypothetical protein
MKMNNYKIRRMRIRPKLFWGENSDRFDWSELVTYLALYGLGQKESILHDDRGVKCGQSQLTPDEQLKLFKEVLHHIRKNRPAIPDKS